MKQGRASHDGVTSVKVEPTPHAINPGYVNQLGNHVGRVKANEEMHQGRGFKAPMDANCTHYKGGSQGRR